MPYAKCHMPRKTTAYQKQHSSHIPRTAIGLHKQDFLLSLVSHHSVLFTFCKCGLMRCPTPNEYADANKGNKNKHKSLMLEHL